MSKYLSIIMVAAILTSCNIKPTTKDDCERLSMESFRGLPNSTFKLKKYCKGINLVYTKSQCQKALNDLVITGSKAFLEKKYGNKIMNCFNEKDKNNFIKR